MDFITPNETETEQFTGIAVNTIEDCRAAAQKFIDMAETRGYKSNINKPAEYKNEEPMEIDSVIGYTPDEQCCLCGTFEDIIDGGYICQECYDYDPNFNYMGHYQNSLINGGYHYNPYFIAF